MRLEEAQEFVHGPDIEQRLRSRAAEAPDQLYGVEGDDAVTLSVLDERVDDLVVLFRRNGISPGARVAVALPTTVQHAATVLALFRIGALWVPMNTGLKGLPLRHQLDDAAVTHCLVPDSGELADDIATTGVDTDRADLLPGIRMVRLHRDTPSALPPDTALLMYTSGTTGPPKGVRVSASMLRASVLGVTHVADVRPGDVLYLWEPLFHIGGAQTMLVPLYTEASLAFAPRFSASRFWSDIERYGVTHVHYLGGVLQILLQLPVSEQEKRNRVRVAWGAGATPALWRASKDRFGFAVHECYGMTETSSIVTVNKDLPDGGVGYPLPWFDVEVRPLRGRAGSGDGEGAPGEIVVRGRFDGAVTSGYLGNPKATSESRDGEWFRTGDTGRWDPQGRLHFDGRASDSFRVRGENVSAWQIEEVFGQHPQVGRCAVVGVAAEVGEQEMMLVFTAADGADPDPREVLDWGAQRLARFQVPRFARVVDSVPLTPSQRIAKHSLPRETAGAVEATVHRR